MASPPLPPSQPLAGPISPAPEPRSLKDPPGPRGLSWPHPSPLSPPSHKGDLTGSAFGSSISGTVPTSPQSFPVVTTGPLEALAMSPGLGSSRCPPQTTLPAVLRPLLARPHARTAPHLNQASHSLEAGPGPRGPPQVLAQGVHELTQLLGAHGHLLPDQLQVLWGHRGVSARPPLLSLPETRPPQTFLQRRQDNSAKTEPKTPPHSRKGSFLHQKWRKRTRTERLKADDSHAQAGHHTRVGTEGLCGRRELPAWQSGPRHHKIKICFWSGQCVGSLS